MLDDADFSSRLTVTDTGRPKSVDIRYGLLQGKTSRVRKVMTERMV
ncbi:hypothetical protein [Streptomyces hokutonensis]